MATQKINEKSENTKTAIKIPEWLKPEIFEDLLNKTSIAYKKIIDFKAKPALSPGENYATIMLRIEITIEMENGKTKFISYMLKVGHDTDIYKDLIQKHNFFDVECGMYLKIVPEMEQMYRDIGLNIKFSSNCYKLPIKQNHVLLEDLRPRGFKNTNRLEGLDLEHTEFVLKKLAQWHAASATRVEKKGTYSDLYNFGYIRESQKDLIQTMNESNGKVFLKSIKKLKDNESYIDCLERLIERSTDLLYQNSKIDPNEFNVLNHGDCWSNNIMFQYDDLGKIKETYFVDYQVPKYGSPAQDLLYFLISSTKLEIKLKEFEYFIKYYHDELIEHLKLLGYPKKIPTLNDIHNALKKYGFWGYYTMSNVMAAVLADPTENASFDNFVGDSEDGMDFKTHMYTNERYQKHAETILPWLHKRGALEC